MLNPPSKMPCCIMGNFNQIAFQYEKWGRNQDPESQMKEFRKALAENDFCDVGWKGNMFTWSNRHLDNTFTKGRLDRVVANPLWSESFHSSSVEVLDVSQSNHKALLLDTGSNQQYKRKKRRLFRFEAKWILDGEGKLVVEQSWKRAVGASDYLRRVFAKLNKEELRRWSVTKVRDVEVVLKQKSEQLNLLQNSKGPHNVELIKQLQEEVGFILEQRDLKWSQRAKRNWYHLGDKNTKFFHSCASQRKRKNMLKEISDSMASMVLDQEGIERVFLQFFNNLFRS